MPLRPFKADHRPSSPVALLAGSMLLLAACSESPKPPPPPDHGVPIEATSLTGEPLPRPVIGEDFRAEQERLLAEARKMAEEMAKGRARETAGERGHAEQGDELDALIWQGRRLAYLGRYRDAIDHYTLALDRYPQEPRLLRHRGHRYITVRRLSLAIADFERAAELIEDRLAEGDDPVEPDGLPNARNDPRSTLGTNVFYHLGLAHYLRGDWPAAVDAYRRCLALSKNDDMRVASTYWLVLALARSAPPETTRAEIESLLQPTNEDLDVIENHAYQRLLLAFDGRLNLAELIEQSRQAGGQAFATTTYGAAAWMAVAGDGNAETAENLWREMLESDAWPAFGYIAAEAEIARLDG